MTEQMRSNPDVDSLASAVAHRFAASAGTVASQRLGNPTLVDRLASAVGQRLAARTGTDIDRLASAVAHRLAASEKAAPLVASAAASVSGGRVVSPELAKVASRAVLNFGEAAER